MGRMTLSESGQSMTVVIPDFAVSIIPQEVQVGTGLPYRRPGEVLSSPWHPPSSDLGTSTGIGDGAWRPKKNSGWMVCRPKRKMAGRWPDLEQKRSIHK